MKQQSRCRVSAASRPARGALLKQIELNKTSPDVARTAMLQKAEASASSRIDQGTSPNIREEVNDKRHRMTGPRCAPPARLCRHPSSKPGRFLILGVEKSDHVNGPPGTATQCCCRSASRMVHTPQAQPYVYTEAVSWHQQVRELNASCPLPPGRTPTKRLWCKNARMAIQPSRFATRRDGRVPSIYLEDARRPGQCNRI